MSQTFEPTTHDLNILFKDFQPIEGNTCIRQSFKSSQEPGFTLLPSPIFEDPAKIEQFSNVFMPYPGAQSRPGHDNSWTEQSNEEYLEALEAGFGISTANSLDPSQYFSNGFLSDNSVEQQGHIADVNDNNGVLIDMRLGAPSTEDYLTNMTTSSYEWPSSYVMSQMPLLPSPVQQNQYVVEPYSNEPAASFTTSPRPPLRLQSTPLIQHHVPQQRYFTPQPQGSPFQWTPQTMTPGYQEARSYATTPMQMSAAMPSDDQQIYDETVYPSQPSKKVKVSLSLPGRRKPHMRPTLSDASIPSMYPDSRLRANSASSFYPPLAQQHSQTQVLPQFLHPDTLNVPRSCSQSTMAAPTILAPATPARRPSLASRGRSHSRSASTTPLYRSHSTHSASSLAQNYHTIPICQRRPLSPPPHDFAPLPSMGTKPASALMKPQRQEVTNPADVYTPRWKRRTSNNRWEGWCGYCVPGRWLDLKNSRFWEDKLRNHGVCAKTKVAFEEPIQVRWVDVDGDEVFGNKAVNPVGGEETEIETTRREGLCGTCKKWVAMDGIRTKARGRAVGWWMHAYKCHDHDAMIKFVERQHQQRQQQEELEEDQ